MIPAIALFTQLWPSCAGPTVAVTTGASLVSAESKFDTLAIHDNTTTRSYAPVSRAEAIAIATALYEAGDSLDLGLMQINTANLRDLGVSIPAAFDACRNMAAGAQILLASYLAESGSGAPQMMLRRALSRYNTGNPETGFSNGYVARVETAATQIVPAIRALDDVSGNRLPKPAFPGEYNIPRNNDGQLIDALVHQDAEPGDDRTPSTSADDPLIHPSEIDPLSDHSRAPARVISFPPLKRPEREGIHRP
jgi:type IV secretion system protein VirB1